MTLPGDGVLMRDQLIHSLRLARGDWYRNWDRRSLEEFLADAILAEFVVLERAEYDRMIGAWAALGRVDEGDER